MASVEQCSRSAGPPAVVGTYSSYDNGDAAQSLADVVALLGHCVEVVHDAPSAIAMTKRTQYDVVLCDLKLMGPPPNTTRARKKEQAPVLRRA